MECLKATELLSAAYDGEPVEQDELAAAEAHCRDCASCAQFAETIARIDGVLVRPAPAGVHERLHARVDGLLAEREQLRAALTAPADGAEEPLLEPVPVRRVFPARLVAFASAAAVLLLAVGVTSVALLRGLGATDGAAEMADTGDTTAIEAPLATTPEQSVGTADDARSATSLAGAAPAYITVDGVVWLLAGPARVDASELTTATSFLHALEDTGTPEQRVSYRAGDDTETLYVRTADGHLAFTRVVRSLGRQRYALVSGTPILRFGEWPTLPTRFKQPQSEDGSPTFRTLAKDDLNVDVYVPPTGDIAAGFAIAPGTAPTDPAAGNPNWTWWEPLR